MLVPMQPRMRTERTRQMVRDRLKTRVRVLVGVRVGTAGSVRACEKRSPTPTKCLVLLFSRFCFV